MDLYPIGALSGGSGTGAIDSVNYSFFEPNRRVHSSPTHTTLVTRFQSQTLLARKKADPFLTITYEYAYIFNSEYMQIEHFIHSQDDATNPFMVVDLSKGEVPTAINTASTWIASIPNTRLYSATTNMKANYVFFWNAGIAAWKLGTVTAVTANTSVTCDVDTNNFGAMTDAQGAVVTGNNKVFIYPVYECYFNPNSLDSFKVVHHWPNTESERGFMRSGSVSFVSKYKV